MLLQLYYFLGKKYFFIGKIAAFTKHDLKQITTILEAVKLNLSVMHTVPKDA
jgi:hypothetical protein